MRAADVVGRKIVKITQRRVRDSGHQTVWELERIELDNGTWITFNVAEMDGGYAVEAMTLKDTRRK